MCMAYTEAQQKPAWEGLGEGSLACNHCHRVTGVDICDTGSDNDPLGRTQQYAGMSEWVTPNRFCEPQRPITKRLSFLDCLSSLR